MARKGQTFHCYTEEFKQRAIHMYENELSSGCEGIGNTK
jgi:hypothetical protein